MFPSAIKFVLKDGQTHWFISFWARNQAYDDLCSCQSIACQPTVPISSPPVISPTGNARGAHGLRPFRVCNVLAENDSFDLALQPLWYLYFVYRFSYNNASCYNFQRIIENDKYIYI